MVENAAKDSRWSNVESKDIVGRDSMIHVKYLIRWNETKNNESSNNFKSLEHLPIERPFLNHNFLT